VALTTLKAADRVDEALGGAVVAVADFDGVLEGHRRLITTAAQVAARLGAPLVAASLRSHLANERLTSLNQQARLLEALGADMVYVSRHDCPSMRAQANACRFDPACTWPGVRQVIAEADNSNALAAEAARRALKAGRPELAHHILGRPFAMEGIIVEGQKLGRQLGYPTANVAARDYVRPRFGVYATRSRLADGRDLPGVANFGVNPTTGLVDARLEVWLFEFDEDIYGQMLETQFIRFLRPELKFEDLRSLIDQIAKDVDRAREILLGEGSLRAAPRSCAAPISR
jgi:riboflavin kinase/FMN adenylyltransferase